MAYKKKFTVTYDEDYEGWVVPVEIGGMECSLMFNYEGVTLIRDGVYVMEVSDVILNRKPTPAEVNKAIKCLFTDLAAQIFYASTKAEEIAIRLSTLTALNCNRKKGDIKYGSKEFGYGLDYLPHLGK